VVSLRRSRAAGYKGGSVTRVQLVSLTGTTQEARMAQGSPGERYLGPAQVAELLQVSPKTVAR
jgi:hypothetical protein